MRVVLVGSGGHASDVLSCVEALGSYDVIGALDDDASADGARLKRRGVDLLGSLDRLVELDAAYVLGIGYPAPKLAVVARLDAAGCRSVALVHPGADVCAGVSIADGVVVLGGARVSALASLGAHVLVSYLAAIGHDSTVGDCTSVMPGAIVSGDCRIGSAVLIGTNATVLEGLSIGDRATIGAGAVVTEDVPAGATVVGAPPREVR